MSYCRSSGWNVPSFTQSHKMSIGMLVDSVVNPINSGRTKETQVSPNNQTHKQPSTLSKDKQQVSMPNDMEIRSKETLRLKLRQILGAAPSPIMKMDDSRTVEEVANEVMPEQAHEADALCKPRQNSDTIETDSENCDVTIRRPVTRSRAGKRVPTKTRPRNVKTKSLSSDKEECQGPHMAFAQKSAPQQPCQVNFGCLVPGKTADFKRSCGIKPGDMLSRVTDTGNIQQVTTGDKKLPPIDGLQMDGRTISPAHASLNENLGSKEASQNKSFNHSPVTREKDQLLDLDCPVSPQESDNHDFSHQQSPTHHGHMNEPLLKVRKTDPNHPVSLSPHIHENNHHDIGSAEADRGANLKATHVFKSSLDVEGNSGSTDEAATTEDAYANTSEPLSQEEEEEEAENGLFTPEKRDSDHIVSSADKVSPEDIHTSPETGFREKPMLFQTKRHCSRIDHSDSSQSLHTQKANGNIDDALMESLEESPDEGFARVVTLLGLALKRVDHKMTSVTNKRCSDILMSAAEEIHSQLRDVESQIQNDLEKQTSLNKSKRKHLETRLQEQQERLKAIYEKFKDEIHGYLQDCRGAGEVMEEQRVELKGATERQKASHRKLILQAEAAVETHLNDAQRRITSIHKLRRQKMLKLKVAIAECLKD